MQRGGDGWLRSIDRIVVRAGGGRAFPNVASFIMHFAPDQHQRRPTDSTPINPPHTHPYTINATQPAPAMGKNSDVALPPGEHTPREERADVVAWVRGREARYVFWDVCLCVGFGLGRGRLFGLGGCGVCVSVGVP